MADELPKVEVVIRCRVVETPNRETAIQKLLDALGDLTTGIEIVSVDEVLPRNW